MADDGVRYGSDYPDLENGGGIPTSTNNKRGETPIRRKEKPSAPDEDGSDNSFDFGDSDEDKQDSDRDERRSERSPRSDRKRKKRRKKHKRDRKERKDRSGTSGAGGHSPYSNDRGGQDRDRDEYEYDEHNNNNEEKRHMDDTPSRYSNNNNVINNNNNNYSLNNSNNNGNNGSNHASIDLRAGNDANSPNSSKNSPNRDEMRAMDAKEARESEKMEELIAQDRTRCVRITDFILDLFVFNCCVNMICCRCICKRFAGRSRSVMYTTITFVFSWMYFIGAIFMVPYAAQMALNSLATATAVAIFLKRRELALKHFRILTGIFAPIVIFMSAYAVWNLRDTIDEEAIDDTAIKLQGLALFISFINGAWLLISTVFIIVIDDESISVTNKEEVNNAEEEGLTQAAVVTYVVNKIGPISGRFRYTIVITHISFGFLYIVSCIVFTRNNEMLILELVTYMIILILGAICYQYYENKINLRSIQICTQLFILFLGITGGRILYALLGGLDFGNVTELPGRIIAATFLCWFFLLYRTLEVIEFTMNKETKLLHE